MPIITRFPQKLDTMMQRVTELIRKPFIVKTNPAMLHSPNNELAVSFPGRYGNQRNIPVYVSTSEAAIDREGKLTEWGEFWVADQVAAHLAYKKGYSDVRAWQIRFNDWRVNELGPIVSENFKNEAEKGFVSASCFLSMLISHNIASGFGYDPAKNYYIDRCGMNFRELSKIYEEGEIELATEILGIDPAIHPEVLNVFMLNGVLKIAEYWLFLPEDLRQEVIGRVSPSWAQEVNSFLSASWLDYRYEYLTGPLFEEMFTPDEFRRLHETVFKYLAGDNERLSFEFVEKRTADEQRVQQAKEAFDSNDYFAAYNLYSLITTLCVANELAQAENWMIKSVLHSNQNRKDVRAVNLAAEALAERGMLSAAIAFQERVFGIEADLG